MAPDAQDPPADSADEDSRLEFAERMRVTEYFRARLAEEVRRAERYGRSFAVVFVACADSTPREVFNNVRPRLRSTDICEVINSPNQPAGAYAEAINASDPNELVRNEVALILPETDRSGAAIALRRLRQQLAGVGAVRLGVAVYPDDATVPNQLLNMAADGADRDDG
jgi:hypothetical protein